MVQHQVTKTCEAFKFISFRLLFWLDEGGEGVPRKVARANMDGTEATVLLTLALTKLDFIAIDYVKQMLFFTQSDKGTVS